MQKTKLFLTGIALMLCMLSGGHVLMAQSGGAKVTLDLKDVTVLNVLKSIEKNTDYAFFYNNADLDTKKIVSVSADNLPVEQVIEQILPGFRCRFENRKIFLYLDAAQSGTSSASAGGPVELKGVIRDSNGEPLTGAAASIRYNGKLYGATADLDGNFSIILPGAPVSGDVITFSFIGCVDESVPVGTRSNFDITLKNDTELLSESIVVGYGVQKKVNMSGAVAAISEEQLKDRPVASVGQALQGVVPNLNITQSSGQPGAGSSYNIRGNTSPNGGSPLILVDGVETYLDRINSNDIASISVLKDASSAAIYGSQAAFGVILVTTKSGKTDQAPKVSVDARWSMSRNTVSTDYETRGYYSAKIADLFYSTVQGVPYTSYTDYDYQRLWERRNDVTENPERPWVLTEMRNGKLSYVYLANFDWYSYLYDETRPTQDYNVSVSGGSKNVTYLVSARYYGQKGINRQQPDWFDSYNVRSKVSIKIRPWLTLGNNTKFFHSKYTFTGYSSEYDNFRKPTLHALASFVPVNPDGTAVSHTSMTASSGHYIMDGYNAMLQKGKSGGFKTTTEVTTTFDLKAQLCQGLTFNADFSYKFGYLRNQYRSTFVEYSQYPGEMLQESVSSFPDSFSDVVYEQKNYTANAYLAYDNTWNEAHHLTATLGAQYTERAYRDLSVTRQDLLSEDLSDFNLAVGELSKLNGGITEYQTLGIFGRVTYDYKSRYMIEFNGRYDGSSRFPVNHKWGMFPSVSAAWRVSSEPFWSPIADTFSNFKIRASYGSLGNQNIGTYEYYQSINTKGTMDYTHNGSSLSGHAVVDDPVSVGTWETVVSYNLGLDLGFFTDKLTLESDFYIRDTKGILAEGKKLPSIYGASEPTVNANDMRTRGFELSLQWRDSFNIGSHRFDYNIGGTLADYVAFYTRCDNPSDLIGEPYEGMRLGEIWGFRVDGLFADDEEAAEYASKVDMSQVCKNYYNSSGSYGQGVRGGDMKYLDLTRDGEITFGKGTVKDHGDREIIGNSQPRFSYGINAGFNFYGFDFSIFFQGIGHMDWYPGADNQRFWGPYSRPYTTFVPKDFMADVWSEDNTDAYFPRARGYAALNSTNGSLYYTNDRYLQNLAYLRLKNLTLGYTIPRKALMKAGLSNIRVYFSGENLWTWSAVHSKYIDPEQISADSDKKGNVYPWYKTFSLGVTVDF